jgi:hexosaminidase
LLLTTAHAASPASPAIIPLPSHLEVREGAFVLSAQERSTGAANSARTEIVTDPAAAETGRYLAAELRRVTGARFPVKAGSGASQSKCAIWLTAEGVAADLGKEGYTLSVTPEIVVIRARDAAGWFYGVQTLLQLLPAKVSASGVAEWRIPCVEVEDQPRFQWRGLMLDVSRHFFTKAEVEQVLDAMSRYKLNTFHWHLVDDQGWRLEIKKYPRLTEVGAWRKAVGFGLAADATKAYGADGRYGGYYTQADARQVVAYARERHITIVPEIETPGHSSAALMAYPQYSCTGGPFTTDLPGGVFNGVYCVGNDQSIAFVEDVLAEVFEVFPGEYVHIGGDEVPTTNWTNCPKCQALMRAQGMKKEAELESYFIRHLEKFINEHHHRLIGWSEIRDGGLAESATVMDWAGGAVEAATAGHDVVMSPLADCYLDHYQSQDQAAEPLAIGGYLPLSQVYAFEPIPANLPSQYERHILGAQGNLWTEYIPSLNQVEYMLFPRLCALSEVVWSPKASRNWDDFSRRVQTQYGHLEEWGVNYRHPRAEAQTNGAK